MPRKRILLYSHDTYGLGHLRRSLALAQSISQHIPRSRQLLLTGSTVAGAFGLPPRLDMIKLPALSKRSSGEYMPRTLPLSLAETIAWRAEILLQAARRFRPDLVLVDKAPAGVLGELVPTLEHLRKESPETRLVLGMRDIEDAAPITKEEWAARDIYPLLEDVYDAILLYGQRSVFDPVTAYGFGPEAAAKTVECGYLGRPVSGKSRRALRRKLGFGSRPVILTTAGGGGDGYTLIDAVVSMYEQGLGKETHPYIVTGPLMPHEQRKRLTSRAQEMGINLVEFTPNMAELVEAADLVIGMAGYNTVCEILSHRRRALLFPRLQVRQEQRIRASRLQDLGLARMLEPEHLEGIRLWEAIQDALDRPEPEVHLDMTGLARATHALAVLLRGERAHPPTNPFKDDPPQAFAVSPHKERVP